MSVEREVTVEIYGLSTDYNCEMLAAATVDANYLQA